MQGAPCPEAADVSGCLRGEERAWKELVTSYYPLVGAIFRKLLARKGLPHERGALEEEAAAFFGDLCLNRHKTLGAFRREGSFRAYLAVLAANYIRHRAESLLSERARLQEYAARTQVDREAPGHGSAARDDELEAVSWALSRCNGEERVLFQLLYVDGASVKQACGLLGISREALYVRKHRLHQKVIALLNERFPGRTFSPLR